MQNKQDIRLYVIFDRVSKTFGEVYPSNNDETALRAFKIKYEKSPIRDDLQLFILGEWDIFSGDLYPVGDEVEVKCLKPEFIYNYPVDKEN